LWRAQCRLDESFVINTKPLDEKASVTLTIGSTCQAHKEAHTARASGQRPFGVRLTEVVGASLAGASPVLDINDAVSTTGQATRGETGRVWIGPLSSMANGFLCGVLTTFRERHADVQIDATG